MYSCTKFTTFKLHVSLNDSVGCPPVINFNNINVLFVLMLSLSRYKVVMVPQNAMDILMEKVGIWEPI